MMRGGIKMIAKKGAKVPTSSSRLTVTLAPGQREILEKIAAHNETTYAHVVRYAIKKFVEENSSAQLRLEFPIE